MDDCRSSPLILLGGGLDQRGLDQIREQGGVLDLLAVARHSTLTASKAALLALVDLSRSDKVRKIVRDGGGLGAVAADGSDPVVQVPNPHDFSPLYSSSCSALLLGFECLLVAPYPIFSFTLFLSALMPLSP